MRFSVGAGHARDSIAGSMMTTNSNTKQGAPPRQQGKPPGNRALRRGRISLPGHVYLVTATTVNRKRFFLQFTPACAACRGFEDSRTLGDACLLAWVLMPDHGHWIIRLGGKTSLDQVVNHLKSASARSVNRLIGRQGALWQRAYHDHALRAEENLRKAARYIIANPVRAGLVERVGDYPFWNAVWI
jgi:putative transposase